MTTKQTLRRLELLMPAGSTRKMELAIDYGADAVYLGPPLYSLRARDNDFDEEHLASAINYVHQRNKKVYMTLNIFPRNRKVQPFIRDVPKYAAMKPDAFIISDPGFVAIARELAPEIPVHLSVQANCMNWRSVKFWQESLGVERIILSRELAVTEIRAIKDKVPDMELEAFVHGSICMAYSGRCLLSSYMNRRDPNQGVCDNSCREKYKVHYLEDTKNNPGELYEVVEDEHGTYFMNSKDLCMIDHMQELIDAGVISFKVEGRTKSEFYAAMVARSYRGALDDLYAGRPQNPIWSEELHKLTNRGYHTGFMLGDPGTRGQNYDKSTANLDSRRFLGLVEEPSASDTAISATSILVDIRNKIAVGNVVEAITPRGESLYKKVLSITSLKGETKEAVHPGSGKFHIGFESDHRPSTEDVLPKNSLLVGVPDATV